MPANFVFTLTAGRTGTAWLAELLRSNLPDCESHHEILGYDRFGLDTPDLSHFTLFNSVGSVPDVAAFWARKAERVMTSKARWYCETSHLLMKAGLVENIDRFSRQGPVHLIALTRDPVDTVSSYTRRGDMNNAGNQWLWHLDPDYPLNVLNAAPFLERGLLAVRYWYWMEIEARQGLYASLLADRADVQVHRHSLETLRADPTALFADLGVEVPTPVLPAPKNTGKRAMLSDPDRRVVERVVSLFAGDAFALGQAAYAQGHRFA